jgi:hypothetical protein
MRAFAMRHFLAPLAICALLLGVCGATPPAAARGRPVVSDTAAPNLTPGGASSFAAVSPLPSRPPLYQMAPQSVPEGQIGAAPNLGPVTGYGTGGMGRIPGSPPNRPYR